MSHSKKEFTLVTDLTQDLDTIWQGMNRNCQRNIKNAETKDIKIHISEDFDQFYKIYISLFRKKRILPILGKFGFGIIPFEAMKKFGTLFVAKHNGEILDGTVYIENTDSVYSWMGASKRLEVNKSNILYKCGWSPLEGQEFSSKVEKTFVNGKLAYDKGELIEANSAMALSFNR